MTLRSLRRVGGHASTSISVLVLMAVVVAAGCGTGSSTAGGAPANSLTMVTPRAPLSLVEPGTLTVGSNVSYPPQEFLDPTTRQPVGFDLELGTQIAARLGLRVNVVDTPFSDLIPRLNARRFDVAISAMTITSTRSQLVAFVPYFVAGESFVVSQTSKYRPASLDDLCDHTVAVQIGTAEADELEVVTCAHGNPPAVTAYATDSEASAQIEKGAVDAYFTDSPVAAYEVRLKPNLVISGPILGTAPEGIAVRQGDTVMLDAVSRAFAAVQRDGGYSALLLKWNLTSGDVRRRS